MINCRTKFSLRSPAKLNLGLRITGRRADGYHLLESLFWPIDLCDRIEGEEGAGGLVIENHTPTPLESNEKNLAWRALQLAGGSKQWQLRLIKNIPIGGGLGGGSSNAGSVLSHFWGKDPEPARVLEASRLGADVPFFLYGKPSMVYGIGEEVAPIQWLVPPPRLYFLLMVLPIPTSTPAVFADFSRRGSFAPSSKKEWSKPWDGAVLDRYLTQAQNDLEPGARKVTPLVGKALDTMRLFPAKHVALSGSGSTCFGIFLDEATRQESDKALQKFCREHQCRTLRAETFA